MRRPNLPLSFFGLGLGLTLGWTGCTEEEPILDIPACDSTCTAEACSTCVIEGSTATCVALCGPGLTCEASQCVAEELSRCEGGCGPCEVCESSGAGTGQCVSVCGEGVACQAGVCVADDPPPPVTAQCEPACGACEVCDVSGDAPVCVGTCGSGSSCSADGQCIRSDFHARIGDLQGSFEDGPAVTAVCIGCHQEETDQFMATPHWNWTGPTPTLVGHEGSTEIGKKNLVNNFCVAVPSNEKRCSQCHAGYGYESDDFDFDDVTRIDCLVCHADPASGYAKAPKTAGRPVDGVDLGAAARSVGLSEVQNCGNCHFNAGGGDNVKKGDIGSALVGADVATDVHMGTGMSCSNCHVEQGHTILGTGVHNPVSEGDLACEDCHSEAPHEMSIYNEHSLDIACQTCHIPAFSRQQPTKMAWDWSTAGNKTIGEDGSATTTLPDGTVVQSYDYKKGDFVWAKSVRPTYAWHDGGVEHMTLTSRFPEGAGRSQDDPIVLARPTADITSPNAKIYPFKLMKGRQPAHLSERFMIAPKLFGPGGFWAGVPSAEAYTPEAVQALWTQTLTAGARAAGQIAADATLTSDDWGFLFTEMYLRINHEVAPTSEAFGTPPCEGCHFDDAFPWVELGYMCDPIRDPAACGARNYAAD